MPRGRGIVDERVGEGGLAGLTAETSLVGHALTSAKLPQKSERLFARSRVQSEWVGSLVSMLGRSRSTTGPSRNGTRLCLRTPVWLKARYGLVYKGAGERAFIDRTRGEGAVGEVESQEGSWESSDPWKAGCPERVATWRLVSSDGTLILRDSPVLTDFMGGIEGRGDGCSLHIPDGAKAVPG